MPSQFHQYFKDVGFPTLLSDFGEPVVYFLAGGGRRSVDAIVDRRPPAIYDAAGEVVLPAFTVRLLNDCVLGILSSEVNTGGDEVELIAKIGDLKPVRKTVLSKVREDTGVIELALM